MPYFDTCITANGHDTKAGRRPLRIAPQDVVESVDIMTTNQGRLYPGMTYVMSLDICWVLLLSEYSTGNTLGTVHTICHLASPLGKGLARQTVVLQTQHVGNTEGQ